MAELLSHGNVKYINGYVATRQEEHDMQCAILASSEWFNKKYATTQSNRKSIQPISGASNLLNVMRRIWGGMECEQINLIYDTDITTDEAERIKRYTKAPDEEFERKFMKIRSMQVDKGRKDRKKKE